MIDITIRGNFPNCPHAKKAEATATQRIKEALGTPNLTVRFIDSETTPAPRFEDLLQHLGHKIVIAKYELKNTTYNVAIECENCQQTLFQLDNPEEDRITPLNNYLEEIKDNRRIKRVIEKEAPE